MSLQYGLVLALLLTGSFNFLAAEEPSSILTTLEPVYSNNNSPFSSEESTEATEQAQVTTATPTTIHGITTEESSERAGITTTPPHTTTKLTDSLDTSILEKNPSKIRGRRYEERKEYGGNPTQLQNKVIESFDSYIYRAEKNLQRIQLMFHRQIKKFLPRLKSNLTVV